MIRLLVGAAGAIGVILLTAFVAARLLHARRSGVSIRMQVFLALGSIVGAFALGLGLLVLDRIEARAATLAEESARDEAGAIAALVAGEIETHGASLEAVAGKLEAQRGRGVGGLHLSLLDPTGRAVFASGPYPDEPGTVSAILPIVTGRGVAGSVRVVKPTIVVKRLLADFAPTILALSSVLGAAAALAAAIIGRSIAAPIEALSDFAARVSDGERRAPPPPVYGREVQRLTRSIDSMRRELEGRPFVETFAADLSHELKNPVAAIRASAEVLADGALDERENAQRFVARIQEAVSRIEVLLGELLGLARLEARGVGAAVLVDLATLVRQAAIRARDRGGEVEVTAADDAGVRGDPAWLARAVDNLLDNARTHGEAGAPIAIALERAGDRAVVRVTSRGSVHRHVQKRLFRRFATTRAERGGTGLGLAIVRAIAEAHSGTAECTAEGPPVVEFRLSFPAA